MNEMSGDLWEIAADQNADAVVITTNGFVKSNGDAVMGRGCALEAAQRLVGVLDERYTVVSYPDEP